MNLVYGERAGPFSGAKAFRAQLGHQLAVYNAQNRNGPAMAQ